LTGNQKAEWPQNLEVKGNQIFESLKKQAEVQDEQKSEVKEEEPPKKFELRSRINLRENSTKSDTLDILAKAVEGVAETLSTVITAATTTTATTAAVTPPTTTSASLLMFLSNQGNNCNCLLDFTFVFFKKKRVIIKFYFFLLKRFSEYHKRSERDNQFDCCTYHTYKFDSCSR